MKNKKLLVVLIILLSLLIIIIGVFAYIKILIPYCNAVKDYNDVSKIILERNNELDNKIKKIHDLIDSNEKVIDESIISTAKEITQKAEVNKYILEKMPKLTKEIIKKTEELNALPDYTEIYKELDDTYVAYETSINQYKQLTNPTEEFVIQRIQTIDEISDVRAVTEDNDPNGKLNKPGGYTSTVYIESKNVNQNNVYGSDLISKGTDAGGAIEVYANEDDAKKRETYLAGFDGGILASGSHRVVGTVLIRTSDNLTATQQKNLEEKIIASLIELK